MTIKGPSVELENVRLYTEPNDIFPDKMDYFLELVYRVETKSRVERVTFPKISLPLYRDHFCYRDEYDPSPACDRRFVDVGFGDTPALNGGNPKCAMMCELIEEKVQDFTMEELEKIVGGKIRIVKEHPNGDS